MYSIGIDIGGTTIKAGLVGEGFELIESISCVTPSGSAEKLASAVAELVSELKRRAGAEVCNKIGVTVPGTFDENGIVKRLCNLGVNDIPLVALIENELPGAVITLCNDADAAALAELRAGSLQGVETGVVITIGTGIGAGVIINGRLFTGGLKRGTELGHAVLRHGGKLCSCGNRGCAETLCSATALAAMAQTACNEREGMIYSLFKQGRPADAKLLIDCAAAGDPYAVKAFASYMEALSDLTASCVNVFDPQVIAIGGGVSAAGDFLLEPLRVKTAEKCFFGSCGKIVAALLGNDAGMIGAAAAANA